jgi:pilus assembly protein Flp/PilA
MSAFVKKLLHNQCGTSAIEMGLICALIVLAMMTALENFAGESQLTWNTISSKTKAAVANGTGG